MSEPDLALDGGPRAVTGPPDDGWKTVTGLEKQSVMNVLDGGLGESYSQIDGFQEEFRAFTGSRFAIATCNGTAALHSAVFASCHPSRGTPASRPFCIAAQRLCSATRTPVPSVRTPEMPRAGSRRIRARLS